MLNTIWLCLTSENGLGPSLSGSGCILSQMESIRDLKEGHAVTSHAQLRSKQIRVKRNREIYLALLLGDRTGTIEAKIWDDVDDCQHQVQEGDFVKYRGTIELYNGSRQIIVERIRKINLEEDVDALDKRDLIPCTEHDVDQMWLRLNTLVVENTRRPCIRQLLTNILKKHQEKIRSYPAAKEIHHNYWGGFLEHVSSVLESALFFAKRYPSLDQDLLVAGAILHDIGKLEELQSPENPSYTTRGTLIGHVVLGHDLARREAASIPDFPDTLLMLLEHLILSHQGQPEWGSPRRPQIPEALVLHYLDDLDAKMNRFYKVLKEDPGNSDFTQFDRYLGRVIFRGKYDETEQASPMFASHGSPII